MPHFNPVPVSNKKFVFDDFILNMDGSLLRSEKKVNIPPKEYAVLVILLEAAGEIVSKNTLLDQVWGDAEVNEDLLPAVFMPYDVFCRKIKSIVTLKHCTDRATGLIVRS